MTKTVWVELPERYLKAYKELADSIGSPRISITINPNYPPMDIDWKQYMELMRVYADYIVIEAVRQYIDYLNDEKSKN